MFTPTKGGEHVSDREGLLEDIVAAALTLNASDIHFDPVDGLVEVLFRVHGSLLPAVRVMDIEPRVTRAVVQRLKVLGRLALGDQRRAQDGHIRMQTFAGTCDLRVAIVPTVTGERAVARLVSVGQSALALSELGMHGDVLAEVRQVSAMRSGLILVAGRVGAGKSTTMRSLLKERSDAGESVLTIEDPVELMIPCYRQIAVDEKQGWTFAECLRAALRQDPDCLMVGEIRDEETAQIAVRAGLTGHLIVTSVHASAPEQAILRLVELGNRPSFVRQAVVLVIWQRLVRTVCPDCHGEGCDGCRGTGAGGRVAQFRVLNRQVINLLLADRGAPLRLETDPERLLSAPSARD